LGKNSVITKPSMVSSTCMWKRRHLKEATQRDQNQLALQNFPTVGWDQGP
jgi:hypothetical protein